MALTERFENDKIEIVGTYKAVQVRKANIIERDGVEISRTFSRHVLHAGDVDGSNNWVDTDISAEDADVRAILKQYGLMNLSKHIKHFLLLVDLNKSSAQTSSDNVTT